MCTSTTACQANRWLSATITECTGRADDVCFLVVLNNLVSRQWVDPSWISWSIMPSLMRLDYVGLYFSVSALSRSFCRSLRPWFGSCCCVATRWAQPWHGCVASLYSRCVWIPKSAPCFRLCCRCLISWRPFQRGTDSIVCQFKMLHFRQTSSINFPRLIYF